MIAWEWNIGIDTYTVSPIPSPNRPASIRPGTAIFPRVHLTALGSPLVPDVKISMSRSSGVANLKMAVGRDRSALRPPAARVRAAGPE
jgi:hypothetical protein